MKKSLFLCLLAGLLLVVACSSNTTETPVAASAPLNSVKKITEKIYYPSGVQLSGVDFIYENGIFKQFKSSDGIYRSDLEYAGDKIISIKTYVNGTIQTTNNFTYVGDLLQTVTGDNGQRVRFTYQGQILRTIFNELSSSNNWYVNDSKTITFDVNANSTEDLNYSNFGGMPATYKSGYNYDNKNNPFKQMNRYFRMVFNTETTSILNQNNQIAKFSFSSPTSTVSTQSEVYEIIYNTQEYPTLIKKRRYSNNELVSELSIEYN